MGLKADLHLHSREGEAFIADRADRLVERAARDGFQVLSITNHDIVTYGPGLAGRARDRGILLIPGVEATIEGKHVLVYNLDVPPARIRTFADLRRYRTPEWLVVAPHPFFPGSVCLGNRLREEIDLFDAIEFSHFYSPRVDFNRAAVRLARETGLPLLGTSDSHLGRQLGTTYSLIEGESTIPSVLAAVRCGRVAVATQPLTIGELTGIAVELVVRSSMEEAKETLGELVHALGRPSRRSGLLRPLLRRPVLGRSVVPWGKSS